MDTMGSGTIFQDPLVLSKLDLPSSPDPVDGFNTDDVDVSIWVKGENFKLPDFTLQ